MSELIRLVARLLISTLVGDIVLLVGIVFTTAMFQGDQYPEALGRTWQDIVLIVFVLVSYVGYVVKIVFEFVKER